MEGKGLCRNGHDLSVVGFYVSRRISNYGTVSEWKQCRQCKKDKIARSTQKRREKAAKEGPSKPRRPRGRPGQKHENRDQEIARTNAILAMVARKDRASTQWERDDLQRQISAIDTARKWVASRSLRRSIPGLASVPISSSVEHGCRLHAMPVGSCATRCAYVPGGHWQRSAGS